MTESGLRSALDLTRRRAGWLLHPPGASPYLAVMLAVAGFEVGFNTPNTIADTLALRTLMTDGLEAFVASLRGLPEPSNWAVGTALVLLALCLATLGGWINSALTVVKGAEPTAETWNRGLVQSARAIFWLGLIGTLVLVAILGTGVLAAGLLRAWLTGTLGDGLVATAMPIAAGCAFVLTLVAGAYVLGSTYLMGVVAVAEPQTRFFAIPRRSREVFQAGNGWRFFSRMVSLLVGWLVIKLALSQLIVPFQPVPAHLSQWLSVASSVMNGVLMFGDGVVALVGIVMAVQIYQQGVERLER